MLVNLDAVPAWTVVLAEILGLGVLGVIIWFITPPERRRKSSFRRRIPVALGVLVVLALVQTAIQERGWRVAAWLIDAAGLTVALTALGRHGGPFAKYWRIQDKYGEDSKELKAHAAKLALRTTIICIVLLALAAVLIKGAYSQGTWARDAARCSGPVARALARLDPVTSHLCSTNWIKLKASEKMPDAGRARTHRSLPRVLRPGVLIPVVGYAAALGSGIAASMVGALLDDELVHHDGEPDLHRPTVHARPDSG